MSNIREGIRITNSVSSFADHLQAGQSGFLPFGDKMYSWHGIPKTLWKVNAEEDGLTVMFDLKKRPPDKPCVLTPSRERASELIERENIFDPSVTNRARTRMLELFQLTPAQSSLGILCKGNQNLRSEVLHATKGTVGVMIPGKSDRYRRVIDELDMLIAGTSSNPSKLLRSRGSGAHRLEALIVDFGDKSQLCVLLPRELREPRGGSSSILELSSDGTQATIIRTGNLSLDVMKTMCAQVGIDNIDVSQIKEILPYDMSGFPGGETFAWAIFQYYSFLTRLKGDVRAPLWLVEQLRRRMR